MSAPGSKLPTPFKNAQIATKSTLKRKSSDKDEKPPAKKVVRSSGYGKPPITGSSQITNAQSRKQEKFTRGILPKIQQNTTGRATLANASFLTRSISFHNNALTANNMECKQDTLKSMELRLAALEADKTRVSALADRTNNEKDVQIEEIRGQNSILERNNDRLESENRRLQTQLEAAKDALANVTSSELINKSKVTELETQLLETRKNVADLDRKIAILTSDFERKEADLTTRNDRFNEKCQENETIFRRLHNEIVDLKGNIRVMVRVRPILKNEDEFCINPQYQHLQFFDGQKIAIKTGKNTAQFEFQRTFSPFDTQMVIFGDLNELITSSLHGFNVTILAYGQTGSGKTYTMQGETSQEEQGIIPRSVDLLFQARDQLIMLGWKYQLSASFLEIYNEECYDLLGNGKEKLDIKVGSGRVIVHDLTVHKLDSVSTAIHLLSLADEKRSVGATKCNARSSRSHAVFQMHISGNNTITGESCESTLSMVDLAGSERLKESGAEGLRLIETQHINTALSNLQNVIRSQAKKTGHVPYRNSKLTLLLQTSLGAGNSKTLMIVNVSPLLTSADETRRSLEFAAQTSKTNIGAARKVHV